METNALTGQDAEFLLFAFDADLDTQIDMVPFGASGERPDETAAAPALQD